MHFCSWAHQLDRSLPSSAFPCQGRLSTFLVMRHLLEVCLFSRAAKFEPLSMPLQHSLRFFQHPVPTASSVSFTTALPKGRHWAYPVPLVYLSRLGSNSYADGATSAAGIA